MPIFTSKGNVMQLQQLFSRKMTFSINKHLKYLYKFPLAHVGNCCFVKILFGNEIGSEKLASKTDFALNYWQHFQFLKTILPFGQLSKTSCCPNGLGIPKSGLVGGSLLQLGFLIIAKMTIIAPTTQQRTELLYELPQTNLPMSSHRTCCNNLCRNRHPCSNLLQETHHQT